MNALHISAQLFSLGLIACLAMPAAAQTPAAKREQFKKESAAQVEAPLSPELLAIAERVQTGRIPCELGHNVALLADEKSPGYFTITTGSSRFRAIPVPTTTGAIRLEDKARGGVWLQLANKSMLLDEKNGKRLADECLSPSQKLVADAMRAAPPTSIIGSPAGTVPNAAPLPQADATAPAAAPAATPLNLNPPPR
jgi:hypothetical protein